MTPALPPADPRPRRLGSLLVDPTPLRLDRDCRLLWLGQAFGCLDMREELAKDAEREQSVAAVG